MNALLHTATVAYAQANKMNSNLTNAVAPENMPLKKVHVNDIDIAYKIFGTCIGIIAGVFLYKTNILNISKPSNGL